MKMIMLTMMSSSFIKDEDFRQGPVIYIHMQLSVWKAGGRGDGRGGGGAHEVHLNLLCGELVGRCEYVCMCSV